MTMNTPGRVALLTIVGLWLTPLVQAQPGPDTTSAWRYFPLEVGNVWEYSNWHLATLGDTLTGYLRWSVVGTADEGDHLYHVIQEERYDPDGAPLPDSTRSILVRFDTLSARLLQRGASGTESGWPFGFPCPLDADFGAVIECDDGDIAFLGGGYTISTSIGDTLFVTTVKSYYMKRGYDEDLYRFVVDIGLQRRSFGVSFQLHDYHQAEYVRVGGVEYGEPIPVATESPSPASHVAHLEQSTPNPARGATTISFTLPEPAHVRLTVFDLLGREVARLVDETKATGRHRVRFETAALPAGVYVYRLEAAGAVQARTMAVVR